MGIAVLTALLTTLVVEYFAKPQLEARKERLIHNRNQIEEVIFLFQELGLTLGSLGFNKKADFRKLASYIEKQVEHALLVAEKLQAAIPRLQLKYALKNKKHIASGMILMGELLAALYSLQEATAKAKEKEIENYLAKISSLKSSLELVDYTFELSRHSWAHKLVNGKEASNKSLKLQQSLEAMGHKLD